MKKNSWYNNASGFFGPGYINEYENILTKEKTKAEITFLEKVLKLKYGFNILDCPCGYGRHSIELARRGYKLTGQDISSLFLKKAEMEAKRLNLLIQWVKEDMRNIKFKEKFDIALCLFSSFGYLENDDEHQKFLKQIAKSLKYNGKFVLDVINRDHFIRTYQKITRKQLPDGSIVISKHNFNQSTGQNLEKRTRIWANGKQEEVFHFVRMYTVPELISMLNKVGLETKKMFGDFDANPITFNSKRYILISEKS